MAELELTAEELRVLGCLMEKEMTTPEYYPLSLNGLLNACNQKSNREPVVAYDEEVVREALDELKANHLVFQSDAARVPKYEHLVAKAFKLVTREMAVLCLLLLRGPQTMGQLRSRSERMYSFNDLDEVSETLESLEDMELVQQLPRRPGQKERRFRHLLGEDTGETMEPSAGAAESDAEPVVSRSARITALEEELRATREELVELRQAFLTFKQQFE